MDIFVGRLARPLAVCLFGALLAATTVGFTQSESSAQSADAVVGPGESIQKAVNAADPGDAIAVKGVHREDVVIRKDGISLRGIDDAVIEAPARANADSPCSKVFGPEAICVLGDVDLGASKLTGPRVEDVSVSGFAIRGFETAGPDGNAFVIDFYGTRNATITGNRVTGNVAGAVAIGRSIDATYADNDVISDPRNATNGIDVEAGSRNTKIANNVVRGYDSGIAVDKTVGTTIEGNDLLGNPSVGIGAGDTTGTKIRSNVVSRSGGVGIFMRGPKPANAQIVCNDVSGGAWGIFITDTHGGTVAGNEIRDNCAGMFFEAFESQPVGGFEVTGNTVEDNARSCRGADFGRAFSGIGIALLGARGMEVTGNDLSGNVPSGPTRVSGGVVVAADPYFDGTIKPRNNSVVRNDFGRNRPDIFWDGSGSGNRFAGNDCDKGAPARLCD